MLLESADWRAQPDGSIRAIAFMKNTGQTPALNVTPTFGMVLDDQEPIINFDFSFDGPGRSAGDIGAGQRPVQLKDVREFTVVDVDGATGKRKPRKGVTKLTPEQLRLVAQNKLRFYLIVHIRYEDVFPSFWTSVLPWLFEDIENLTKSCLVSNPDGSFAACRGNRSIR